MSVEKQNGQEAVVAVVALPTTKTLDIIPKTLLVLLLCRNSCYVLATNRDVISIFLHGRIELVVMVIWFTLPITCHEGPHGE